MFVSAINAHPDNNVEALKTAQADRSRGVIAATPISGGDAATLPTRVVLRDLGEGEYVTHVQVFTREGKHQGFIHGHYLFDEGQARMDLRERAEKYGYNIASLAA